LPFGGAPILIVVVFYLRHAGSVQRWDETGDDDGIETSRS
jgi:hypothetical protein